MSNVAYNTGYFFSNLAPTDALTEHNDDEIQGHGAALARSGYNLNGSMTGSHANPTVNLQMNNMMDIDNNSGAVINLDQLHHNSVLENQASTAYSFGNFLLNPLTFFYHHQDPSTQVVPPIMQAAPLPAAPVAAAAPLPPQNIQYYTPNQSPVPHSFFTPNAGTPYNGSPKPQTLNYSLPQTSSVPIQSSLLVSSGENTINQRKEQDDDNTTSRNIFRQGISSVGSALGVVATYINKSLVSGIPFHVADRAMKDSKQTYSRWWDQTVHDENNENDERKRKGDIEVDTMMTTMMDQKVRKKRKVGVAEYGTASSLSQMLAGNYNDANIEAVKKNWRVGKSEVVQAQTPANVHQVDSSIIGPPRRKTSDMASSSGYDAFNYVGSMYGGDIYTSSTVENNSTVQNEGSCGMGEFSFAYDSVSGYYVNSEEDDERKQAALTASAKKYENSTVSNNSLGDTLQAIKEMIEEKNRESDEQEIYQMSFKNPRDWVTKTIRSELVDAIQSVQGDVSSDRFMSSLEVLTTFYKNSGRDARVNPWGDGSDKNIGGPVGADLLEGFWLNMSRPNYVECLGQNAENDFMYTLGRMSFDMFQPGNLICSVQSTHNTIKMIGEREELPACVPNSLKEEVASLCHSSDADSASKRPLLRSYDIAVSMTIEPPSLVGRIEPSTTPFPTKRMRAVMSVKGFILPDPETKNRLTVWFTGGRLCPAKLSRSNGDETDDDDAQTINSEASEYGDFKEWESLFGKGKWRRALSERAKVMAAKVLLGVDMPTKMEDDGHMEYHLNRPVGGHGKAYIDVLYLDDDILIMRGHHGTIYAMARSCVSQRYKSLQARVR